MQIKSKKKIRKVVIFYKQIVAAGGAERLVWEPFRYFNEFGCKATIVTYHCQALAPYDYQIGEDLISFETKNNLRGLFKLYAVLKQIAPDALLVSYGLKESFLISLLLRIPYFVQFNTPRFNSPGDNTKYSFRYRQLFEEIWRSTTGNMECVDRKKTFPFWGRIWLEVNAWLEHKALTNASGIFVVSRYGDWEASKLFGVNADIVKGCVAPEAFSHAPRFSLKAKLKVSNMRIILSICRLSREKRLRMLIRAFHQLLKIRKDVLLVIGGIGEEESRLRELAEQLGLRSRVRFVGFIPEDQLWDYYAGCDLFVAPARADFSISPYEALIQGSKVVWTPEMDQEPELVNGGYIFVAEPRIEEWATAMDQALRTTPVLSLEEVRRILRDKGCDEYAGNVLECMERHLFQES